MAAFSRGGVRGLPCDSFRSLWWLFHQDRNEKEKSLQGSYDPSVR